MVGFLGGIGSVLVSIGIVKYSAPLGKLVPLFNMNTLVTVLLALWLFAEWKEVQVPRLLIGSILIVVGGILVARS